MEDGAVPGTVPTYDAVFAVFAEVVLEESYVLAVDEREGAVEFVLDAVLAPGHDAYRAPLPGEQFCVRRGTLVVTSANRARLRASGAPPAFDATGEQDLGHIDSLIPVDPDGRGSCVREGTWGELEVVEPTIHFVSIDD